MACSAARPDRGIRRSRRSQALGYASLLAFCCCCSHLSFVAGPSWRRAPQRIGGSWGGWRLPLGCPRLGAPLAAATKEVALEPPEAAVAEEWEAEASRCWAPVEDGEVPGFIADLMSPPEDAGGRDSTPWQRELALARKAERAQPEAQRKGERHEEQFISYYSGAAASAGANDVRLQDFKMAMSFFGKATMEAPKSGVVLEVGCGDAWMARHLALSGRFDRVFAVDTFMKTLQTARGNAEKEGILPEDNFFLARADVRSDQPLPFKEGSADFLWWGLGLHKAKDPKVAFKHLFDVLRPGGLLLLTAPIAAVMPEEAMMIASDAGFEEVGVRLPRNTVFALQAVKPV